MAGVLDDVLVMKVDRGHAKALAVTFCRVTTPPTRKLPIYLGSSGTLRIVAQRSRAFVANRWLSGVG